MEEQYLSITDALRSKPHMILDLDFMRNLGHKKNIRTISIMVPYRQEVEDLGMQHKTKGGRCSHRDYTFLAIDVLSGLDLLERSYNDFTERSSTSGFPMAQDGLDSWVFSDFNIQMSYIEGQGIVSNILNEYSGSSTIISSLSFKSVDEAVAFYQQNQVPDISLCNLKRGMLIDNSLRIQNRWGISDVSVEEYAFEFLSLDKYQEYNAVLKTLAPFKIREEVKRGLLLSVLSPLFRDI